jgi:cell wall-associated NlpC family hydrolase
MNLDHYIGLPYREGARGPDAFDCYGLVAEVYRSILGVNLPDWYQAASGPLAASRAISAAVAGEVDGGRSCRISEPVDLDIAVVGSNRRPHHVGVVFSGGVLHASRTFGSTWHPMPRFVMLYPHTEFYRWQP